MKKIMWGGCGHTGTQAYMHTGIHAYIHTYLPTYIHTYIHTYMIQPFEQDSASKLQLLSNDGSVWNHPPDPAQPAKFDGSQHVEDSVIFGGS